MAIWPSPTEPALSRADRQWRAATVLVLPLGLLAAPAFLALGDVPLCAFKHLTGVPCPLCGGIRVCAALAQGDLAGAWMQNPGLVPLLGVAAFHTLWLTAEALSAKRLGTPRGLVIAWQLAGAGLFASWAWRLITVA
jgi:hypothetical protein